MKNSTMSNKKVAVLDTSAFIAGFDPFSIGTELYTVPLVEQELRENSMSSVRFKTAVENGKLKNKVPTEAFLDKVKASATLVGDKFLLSETDIQVLALALELKNSDYLPVIITDDYSMQNVANQMDIEFAPLTTFGIRLRLQWIRYCPACHRKYPADFGAKICAVCGTKLKRKPQRKSSLRRGSLARA
jgi:UPF0271 protein